jgi:hypothetical protein
MASAPVSGEDAALGKERTDGDVPPAVARVVGELGVVRVARVVGDLGVVRVARTVGVLVDDGAAAVVVGTRVVRTVVGAARDGVLSADGVRSRVSTA